MSDIFRVEEGTVTCARCTSHHGPFASIPGRTPGGGVGEIYLCFMCCESMTRAMGGLTADEVQEKEAELARLEKESRRLEHELATIPRVVKREDAEQLVRQLIDEQGAN